MRWLIIVLMLLACSATAQDRVGWEGATFVSAGQVGINYADISVNVREYVGPAYSINENSSVMLGFNMSFASSPERPARISIFAGGTFTQYVGLGYAFDLINEERAEQDPRYKVLHSVLFGVLVRYPDVVDE